jgi:4-carboxymuconolactone decarboxylase
LTPPPGEVNTFLCQPVSKIFTDRRRAEGTLLSEPRIPPRPSDDWDEAVDEALAVLRPPGSNRRPGEPRRERPASNILGIFSWHPDLAKGWFEFNNHLFHSTLSKRDRELVTVRIGWVRRGEYEWAQHVRMAKSAGLSDEQVDAIMAGADSPVWDSRDAALLRAVDEIAADRYVSDQTWKRLAEDFDRQQLMDLVFTIGAYDLMAMAFNTFGLQLDPGLTGFPPQDQGQDQDQDQGEPGH